MDLLPTFCEIAGATLPDGYRPDGVSQLQTLLGKPAPLRQKPLFWKMQSRWPIQKSRPFHWVSYAVVHDKWKLMANQDGSYFELYDIAADPLEKTPLQAKHPETASQLLTRIEAWKATLPQKPTGDVFSKERDKP